MTGSTNEIYASLIANVLKNGSTITTRNSQVKRLFADAITFKTTPLVSVRKTAWKNALREWEWFMSGSNHIDDLHSSVRHWWYPWADSHGVIRYNYSTQFRCAGNSDSIVERCDQIDLLIGGVTNHPFSRRNVITTWNTADMTASDCSITNCHGTVIQAFVEPDNSLHLVMYQRSADVICGLPANWIQYWAFLLWLAHRTGRTVGSFVWIGGDIHVYDAHKELADRIVEKAGEADKTPTPELIYTPTSEEFLADDFTLSGEYIPLILDKAEMIV